jgi:hypothetical protein
VRLLHKTKSTHAASSDGNDVDCKPDIMAYMTVVAGCFKVREYPHTLPLMVEMRREGTW